MVCPKCGGKVGVIDTFHYRTTVYRRRKCQKCKCTFHTSETIVEYTDDVAGAWSLKWNKIKLSKEK